MSPSAYAWQTGKKQTNIPVRQDSGRPPLSRIKHSPHLHTKGMPKIDSFTLPASAPASAGSLPEGGRTASGASRGHDAVSGTRAEPYVGDDPQQGVVDPAVSEWVREAAMQERKEWSRRCSRLKPFAVVAVFAVGIAAGIGAAWWLSQTPPFVPQHTATGPTAVSTTPLAMTQRDSASADRRGITLGELPYDGMPPREAPARPAVAEYGTSAAELPYGGSGSSGAEGVGVSGLDALSTPTQPTDTQAQPFELRRATEGLLAVPAPLPRVAEAANGADKRLAQQKQAKPARGARNEKGSDRRATKRRGSQRNMKDKEIERIRRQATEELQKKAQAERSQEEARFSSRGTALESPAAIMRTRLARCEAASNFILREQCKWQLCSGKWGRYGCPSYQTQASTY